MCGRFTLHSRDRIKLKGLASLDLPFEARYNIAPSQSVLTIGDFGAGLEGRLTTWGLIPSWSTDGKGFINARAETLEEKPSFSEPFRLRRCLITTDGNDLVGELHNRMPAILLPDSYDVWLDRKANPNALKKLLSPYPASNM